MFVFCGFEIELFVEQVVLREEGPELWCARDSSRDPWLIVTIDDDPDHLGWVCVPLSERAMQAVMNGRAAPRDVIRHSRTGTVDLVVVDHGRAVPDRCLLCASIPEHLLPADRQLVLTAA